MKKFRYTLETVHAYSQMLLDQRKEELAEWQARIEQKKQQIQALREKQHELTMAFDDLKHNGAAIEKFMMYANMIDNMDQQIQEQYDQLALLEKKADQKKQEVVEANIEVGKYDKLRDKQYEEYRAMAQKEEEAFIEEFVTNMSNRSIG